MLQVFYSLMVAFAVPLHIWKQPAFRSRLRQQLKQRDTAIVQLQAGRVCKVGQGYFEFMERLFEHIRIFAAVVTIYQSHILD